MRRPDRYCPFRMKPKMSWHPNNCYVLWNWSPRPERTMNLYQTQFYAKSHCRLYFNGDVTNSYFKRIHRAYNKNVFDTLIHMERRLDNILFRSMFASSVFVARQMVAGGMICVNGRQELRASFAVSDNDLIHVVPQAAPLVYGRLKNEFMKMWAFIPSYLEVDYATLAISFLRKPVFSEIPHPFPKRMLDDLNGYYYKFS